ncbi:MAG: putative lipid II flippase FtsW [Armatimonadetes bacterium]|nr:putative lipid II flippase FtsW [Armatimonadota bacterium]
MRKKSDAKPGQIDLWLVLLVMVLVMVGIWLVYDSSFATTVESAQANNDAAYFAKRQGVFALIGLVLMYVASWLRLSWLSKIAAPLLLVSIVLLIGLYGFGTKVNGALRWYKFGPLTVQPSELAKLAIVIYLADFFSQGKKILRNLDSRWAMPLMLVAAVICLIAAQPDLGTALAIVATCLAMWIAAGARKRHIALVVAGMGGLLLLLITVAPYRLDRVKVWLDPWHYRYDDGYQVVHSLIALARGNILGCGLCEGLEKLYLPATSTDFIFSTLGEETGLLGGLALLTLFVLFIFKGLDVGCKSASVYADLLAVGITSMIGLQALINVAVVSSFIPATGVTLPFMSYGGSSLVVTLVSVGILLAVSRTASRASR